MEKLKCDKCGKEIIKGQHPYYESDDGNVYCEDCADVELSYCQYGWYREEDVSGDPDMMLDDDLADVDFYQYHESDI